MPRYFARVRAPYDDEAALQKGAERLPEYGFTGLVTIVQYAAPGEQYTIIELAVDGPTTKEAVGVTRAPYAQLRTCSDLETVNDIGPIALTPINPLLHLDFKSSTFFRIAEQLFDEKQHMYTVVAVQTAFELYMEGVFEYLLSLRTPREVGTAVEKFLQQRYSLAREEVRELLEALMDEPLTQSDEWRQYKAHVKRRNDLVHRGERLSADEARASLIAVHGLAGKISWRVRTIMPKPSEQPDATQETS